VEDCGKHFIKNKSQCWRKTERVAINNTKTLKNWKHSLLENLKN
jgi:hypothetical protein